MEKDCQNCHATCNFCTKLNGCFNDGHPPTECKGNRIKESSTSHNCICPDGESLGEPTTIDNITHDPITYYCTSIIFNFI